MENFLLRNEVRLKVKATLSSVHLQAQGILSWGPSDSSPSVYRKKEELGSWWPRFGRLSQSLPPHPHLLPETIV